MPINGAPNEFDYLITPDGLSYLMHDGADRFLLSFDGYDMPGYSWQTQQGPQQHGVTVLDYRLQPRVLSLLHRRNGCSRENYWSIRADILNYLRVNRQQANSLLPFQLQKVQPDGTKRNIDVYYQGGQIFPARDLTVWDEASVNAAMRFFAPDPTWYNPTQQILTLGIELCSEIIFPFVFPFIFCGTVLNQTATITYLGTWLTYPIIYITGPVNQPRINNLSTGELIALDYNVPAGTTITIDLRYGYKTVTDDSGNNLIGVLTSDSDLATFHLAADPEAPGGINVIGAGGEDGLPAVTFFRMSYYTRYIGI